MFYFWKKDVENNYLIRDPEYYAKQNFQRFIFAINQSYVRDSSQSAFTNTSVFDRPFFEALFGGSQFPDGSDMIDYEEDIIQFQKWYMETMAEIRKDKMFTFPVSTISLLRKKGKFVDEEFAEWAIRHNMEWSDSNLFIDDDVSSLSNCCFDGKQYLSIKLEDGTFIHDTIKNIYDNYNKEKILVEDSKGEFVRASLIRTERKTLYHITTNNNSELFVTDNHINPTPNGDIKSSDLKLMDILSHVENKQDDEYTINKIEKYTNTDKNNYVYCLEMENQEDPYFTLPNGIITHNCRLKSNIKDLGYFNSVGGTALKVGSVKVSTVNLARIALDTINKYGANEEEYLKLLEKRTLIDLKALDRVRHIIKRNVEKGLLPNFSYGLIDFKYLYNTIGFIGIYESMKAFGYTEIDELGNTYYKPEAYEFGNKIFKTMRATADKFIKDYNCDYMINTEQIPGESAADKLMRKDKFFYPNANIYDLPLYGNQFIPLGIQTTLQERIKIAAAFDKYCNGGSILHVNIDAPFDSYEKARAMTEYIADQGVTYFAYNSTIQTCHWGHAFYANSLSNTNHTCPSCGSPAESEFTRIVG